MRTLFSLLFMLFFCPALSFAQQTIQDTITSGGIKRSYRVHIPPAYTGQEAVPLVFMLHGQPMTAYEMEVITGFNAVPDTANFILVYPNGQPHLPSGKYYWDVYNANSMVDVNFISDLIDTLAAQFNIDANRIYASGISNGGFMSYQLACKLSNRIAAVASALGSIVTNDINACNPPRPVPIMEIHGTNDPTVSYDGGNLNPFGTNIAYVSTPMLINHWIEHNHCDTAPIITDVPNLDPSDGCTAQRYLYAGGDDGSAVELFKITGGGHQWPGGAIPLPAQFGNQCNDFSANHEIWRFLSQYRLDQLTNAPEETPGLGLSWSAFPNPAMDVVTIQFDEPIRGGQVLVADALGRTLKTEIIPEASETHTLNLNGLPAGIYFIAVETEKGKRYTQLVKQSP